MEKNRENIVYVQFYSTSNIQHSFFLQFMYNLTLVFFFFLKSAQKNFCPKNFFVHKFFFFFKSLSQSYISLI